MISRIMMKDVLDVILSIFDCDRAFLMYPCDPESPTWTCPMERNKPEYPGVRDLKLEMPMDPQVAETLRILLAEDGPVTFGPGTPYALPEDVSKQFGIQMLDVHGHLSKNRQSVAIRNPSVRLCPCLDSGGDEGV